MIFLKNKNEYLTFSHPIYVLKIAIDTLLVSLFVLLASFSFGSIIVSLVFALYIAFAYFFWGRRRAPHLFHIIRINDEGIRSRKVAIRWADIQSVTAKNDSLRYKYNILTIIEYPLGLMLEIKSNSNKKILVKATPALIDIIDQKCTESQKEQLDPSPCFSATENLKLSLWLPTAIFILVNIIVGICGIQYLKYSIIICLFAMFVYRGVLEYYQNKY